MHPIAASELILTPAGQVYHLNLRPEELASTIITVGDPDRVKQVSRHFDRIEFQTQHREFVTHTGYIGKKRITVLSSGIGPDNIDIVMNELDACANIDFQSRLFKQEHTELTIIRLGTSGSLQLDIPVDSLVASSYGIGLDNLMHYYQWEPSSEEKTLQDAFILHASLQGEPIVPYVVQSSASLLQNFSSGFHQGITVTCPGFYAPQGRVVRAQLRYPALVDRLSGFSFQQHRITNFEMESAAIFGLGKVFGHQCLAINTIVANRIAKIFTKDAKSAIENMICQSLAIIEKL